jgi:flagellar biosynthesis protein FliQ
MFESRASQFVKDTTTITLGLVIPLLAAYVFTVTEGDYLQAKTSLAEQSLAFIS